MRACLWWLRRSATCRLRGHVRLKAWSTIEGEPVAEIAAVLGYAENTVWAYLDDPAGSGGKGFCSDEHLRSYQASDPRAQEPA